MDDNIEERDQVELALIRQQYQNRYSDIIDYLKSEIGEGTEYRNSVARAVVSDMGAYYELLDLPEEFGGAIAPNVQRHFLTHSDALSLLTRAVAAIPVARKENRQISIFALYTRRGVLDRKGCFIYESKPNSAGDKIERHEIGAFRPDEVPLFFKLRLDANFATGPVQLPSGLSFCMANAGDRYLLVSIPLDAGGVTDLKRPTGTKTVH